MEKINMRFYCSGNDTVTFISEDDKAKLLVISRKKWEAADKPKEIEASIEFVTE